MGAPLPLPQVLAPSPTQVSTLLVPPATPATPQAWLG